MAGCGAALFGVVINHYWRPDHGPAGVASTLLAMGLLDRCPDVEEVVVVDASHGPTPGLAEACRAQGAKYLHREGGLSFPAAFNAGFAVLKSRWLIAMCSDVYVHPETIEALRRFVERRGHRPIGCVVPYLNESDVHTQVTRRVTGARFDARIPIMSTNLNVFPREALAAIGGGLPTQYSGCFNDIAMSIELRRRGLEVLIAGDATALHYGGLTRSQGSDVDFAADANRFRADYPNLDDSGSLWGVALASQFDSRLLRFAWRLIAAGNRWLLRRGHRPAIEPLQHLLSWAPRLQRLR